MDPADMTPPSDGPSGQEAHETMVERSSVAPNVPNVLRVTPIATTTATDVETIITDPVVNIDSFVRFNLLTKGLLHSHSKHTL